MLHDYAALKANFNNAPVNNMMSQATTRATYQLNPKAAHDTNAARNTQENAGSRACMADKNLLHLGGRISDSIRAAGPSVGP